MKRILVLAAFMLSLSGPSFAGLGDAVWIASNTITADTTKSLCGPSKKALLHAVCTNDPGGSGQVKLYNSRGAASQGFAVIRSTWLATSGCQFFDVQLSSGATYTTTAAMDDTTFVYQCY